MRVLFYLPVITPWWFQEIIVPMLRTLQADASVELHVMVAPMWRSTGIAAEHLGAACDLTSVHWHIVDEGEPEDFRRNGVRVPRLLDLVHEIAPDVTLARSADLATTRHFPGIVRFVMEAGAPPFASDQRWVILEEEPFTQSNLPADATSLADDCTRLFRPTWALAEQRAPQGKRATIRSLMGLPADRTVLAVPLHYEHEENLFLSLTAFPDGVAAIEGLLGATREDIVLAVTDHPLNRVHVDRQSVLACMARHAGRVVDCTGPHATQALALSADAMVVDLSKSWSLAAFHGLPIIDIARRPAAHWLRASRDFDALDEGTLTAPRQADARRWFGWHFSTRVIDPSHLTRDRLERVLLCQPSDADIACNIAMVHDYQPQTDREAAA